MVQEIEYVAQLAAYGYCTPPMEKNFILCTSVIFERWKKDILNFGHLVSLPFHQVFPWTGLGVAYLRVLCGL